MSESLPTLDDYLTTDPRDREPHGTATSYTCVHCDWRGKAGYAHMRATSHELRILNSPASWPNVTLPEDARR